MDPTILMYCWYIGGALCFIAGSVIGMLVHLGMV